MRWALWCAAAAALLVLAPGPARAGLATAAAALLEATPFLLAGAALQRVLGSAALAPYFGCGCEPGPAARSVPAAVAAGLIFGPWVAIARWAAGIAVGCLAGTQLAGHGGHRHPAAGLPAALAALLPSALAAAAAAQLLATFDPARFPQVAQVLAGAALGFFAAPCGLGAIAIAASLHAGAPAAAWAFLSVAGIADLRSFARRRDDGSRHDGFAYAASAIALLAAVARHGAGLVHPAFTLALAAGGAGCIVLAWRHRRSADANLRAAPALMLAGIFVAAPPPVYRATETTMGDLFAGERLSFTGQLSRDGRGSALVRYAITCCRADAAPVAVALAEPPHYPGGSWLHADGIVEVVGGHARLRAAHVVRIAPPADPFVYR